MARKTVDIAKLVDMVNRRNKLSTCSADLRHGWNSLMEEVLGITDTYAGFGYLTAEEVPEGCSPGIRKSEVFGNEFPDESRRIYYLK
jgi:hypothetical protein